MNELFIKIPYLLYFIPLIASLFINFITGKRFLTNFTYFILLGLTILSFNLIFHISDYKSIFIVNSSEIYNVIGCEFKIGLYNIFMLITVLFVNFIGFANYIHEIILNKASNITYIKHFFSVYLIYIFSIIGIMTTTNIFHLFIFLEIYSFCMYMIITIYKKHDIKILSYKYFSNNIFGSILNMLTMFYIILYFNTSNIFVIKQQLLTISLKDNIHILLMFFLLICSVILRFLNTNTSKHYNTDNVGINFLSISNIFVNTLIGFYLITDIVYFILDNKNILTIFYFDKIIMFLSSLIIIYNSTFLFFRKYTDNIFSVFLRSNLASFGFVLLVSFLYDSNINMLIIFLIDFISTGMLLYFFSAFISAKYGNNNLDILNHNNIEKYFFVFIILFKLFLPFGTSLYVNKIFINYIVADNLFSLMPFIFNKISMLFLLCRIIINKEILDYNSDKILNKKYINTLSYSIILIFLFVLFFNVLINLLNLNL